MRLARVVLVAIAVVLASLALPGPAVPATGRATAPLALAPHAPIDIEGDAGFTFANGMVSGQGTPADPYVISGWSIASPAAIGVQVRNTNAHAVLRNIAVTDAPLDGFYFYNVANVSLVNVSSERGTGEGIRFESSRAFSVLASSFVENSAGLVVLNSQDALVRGTNLTANAGDGATITGSPNVTLEANNVSFNGFSGGGYGIDFAFTTGDSVLANRFIANGIFLAGDSLSYFDSHTITPDNLFAGLPILYAKDCNGLGLTGMELGEILLAGCHHARVSNLTVAGADVGIEMAFGGDVVIGPGVVVSDARIGVAIQDVSLAEVVDSGMLDTAVGVQVDASTDVRIAGTKIASPASVAGPFDGVVIRDCGRVNVTGNVIRRHRYAISVAGSGNVSLVDNVVGLNVIGMNVTLSRDLQVTGNLLTQDTAGLRLQNVTNATVSGNALLAFLTTGANVTGSSGVRFMHNAFGGVRDNAYDGRGTLDSWDAGYPTGGNYWANYRGLDVFHGPSQNLSGGDGVGDTPYAFDVNAVDRYPLMSSPVTQDVPPEAVISVVPAVGTVLTPFHVSANLSSDFEDALALLQVRWSWDEGANWTPWTGTKFATHVFVAPGIATIRLEVKDTKGLTDNWSAQVLVVPKPDLVPPAILFTPPASAEVGQPIPIEVNVTDPSGIADATLLYRPVDGGAFRSLPMQIENNGTNFTATIPAQPHSGTVEVVIVANDTWANEARAPVAGTSSIRIVDTLAPLSIGLVLAIVLAAAVAVGFLLLRRRRKEIEPRAPPPDGPARPPGNA